MLHDPLTGEGNSIKSSQFIYFFLPATVTFIINVTLFACTAWELFSTQRFINQVIGAEHRDDRNVK